MTEQTADRWFRIASRRGGQPTHWVQAPGRVDLMGSHTDYNQGYVLTMSIDRSTWIAARPRPDRVVAIDSINLDARVEFSLDAIQPDPAARWADYVKGVAHIFGAEGYALRGFDGVIHSTVPLSSGLKPSAALEVATAMLFKETGGWVIEPLQIALLCQRAENQFVGVNCGILDQYTSVHGQAGCAVLLDCRHLTGQATAIDPGVQVVICDTRFKRELSGSEYAERRAQCEEGAAILARHYPEIRALRDATLAQLDDTQTICRTWCGAGRASSSRKTSACWTSPARWRRGDRAAIRALAAASFAGARDLCDQRPGHGSMMAAMLAAPGAIGARQAGAGSAAVWSPSWSATRGPVHPGGARRLPAGDRREPHVYAVAAAPARARSISLGPMGWKNHAFAACYPLQRQGERPAHTGSPNLYIPNPALNKL